MNPRYVLDSGPVTIAAANVSKSNAGTIQLVNGIYNPVVSATQLAANRWLRIRRAVVATVSGTPGGPFVWNAQSLPVGVTCTTAATGAIRSAKVDTIGASAQGSVAVPVVNIAIVRSDAGAAAFTQLGTIGGPTAVAATGVNETAQDNDPDGLFIVPPGCVFGIAAVAAGTTHLVQSTIWWEELPSSPL